MNIVTPTHQTTMYSSIRARQSFFRSDRGLLDALLDRELPNRYPSWETVDGLWDDAHAEYDLLRGAEIDTTAVEGELTCLNRVLHHLMNRGPEQPDGRRGGR